MVEAFKHLTVGEITHLARLTTCAHLVAACRDVLIQRPVGDVIPDGLRQRGWDSYLLGLSDTALEKIEAIGFGADWPGDVPRSLVKMLECAREVCAIPSLVSTDLSSTNRIARRLETPRKRAQVDAFAQVILPLAAHATRILDVGSGHGHLTREIAHQIARPVIGLEREPILANRARRLDADGQLSFDETDVLRDGLALGSTDCVIGLHACGELGDIMVEQAANVGASIALVGCCLQKRRAEVRVPLATLDVGSGVIELPILPRGLLGLSNLSPGNEGVEATRTENLAARQRRLVLHHLLTEQIGPLRLGAEIDGINRRAAHGDLYVLVARGFAHHNLPVPSPAKIQAAAAWAVTNHARVRRLAVPRMILGRVLEVFVLLDRACFLEQHGYNVKIGTLFEQRVSARNLVVVGSL